MIDYSSFYNQLSQTALAPWQPQLEEKTSAALSSNRWGDLPQWCEAVENLPSLKPSIIDLKTPSILVGKNGDCDEANRQNIEDNLRKLHPWRKGPFDVFGVHVETEWRSDFKWERLEGHIEPLKDRLVLDVGCGSGYHCWRMMGEGAKLVAGVDPTMLYVIQFQAMQKYIQNPSAAVLPIGIDDLPDDLPFFDTVFSMGLLYHRRSPLDHLLKLRSLLRNEGELVLETLVIDGKEGQILNPQGRYAKMPNVWFIPSCPTLEVWLKRCGFTDIRLLDVTTTTAEEQRATDWMGFESLPDFLNPKDPTLTIEGYPAPKRAIFVAKSLQN